MAEYNSRGAELKNDAATDGTSGPAGETIADFFTGKRLTDADWEEKGEGWSPIIIPILNYKTGNGFGFGFNGGVNYNGNRKDPYYAYSPFAYEISGQAFKTLRGEQDYSLKIDAPYFLNSPLELIAETEYNKQPDAKYFGIGPEAGRKRYTGGANNSYNEYNYSVTGGTLAGIIHLATYFRLSLGYNFKNTDVSSLADKKFDVLTGQNILVSPTLIDTDPAVNSQKRHGLISTAMFGIGFDTRDFTPDPRNGIFIDYTINISSDRLGADFNFTRYTAGARFYFTPAWKLTFAARVAYTTVSGDVPFYELGNFSFLEEEQAGLGNDTTLRGYQYNRFIGYTMTVGNLEARWELAKFTLFRQNFSLKLLAFIDAGSVFSHSADPMRKFSDYHTGYGPGLAVVYNLSTIIHLYVGFSKEDRTVSLDFNHAF